MRHCCLPSAVKRLPQVKISRALRDAYGIARERYDRLAAEVRGTIKSRAEERGWFFSSRVKELESYALKVETGRVGDPSAMEDFLGCTIVVPNALALPEAEAFVLEFFELKERRTPDDASTRKPPHSFLFDDIRLYVRRGADDTGKTPDLDDLPFEIQLKTALQYAWGIATRLGVPVSVWGTSQTVQITPRRARP